MQSELSTLSACLVNTRENTFSPGRQSPNIPYDKY